MSLRPTRLASVASAAGLALATLPATGPAAAAAGAGNRAPTTTPIKHVIVIIGENHTFDNVFATYMPPAGQKIWNLRSEGVVTASGTPGPDFSKAAQLTASDTKTYSLTPKITGSYRALPQPNTTYAAAAATAWVASTAGDDNGTIPARSPSSRAGCRRASTTWPRATRRSWMSWPGATR